MMANGGGRLAGKVALVTGAGTGIGRAVAIRFAEEGADVVVTSRTPAHVDETCQLAAEASGRRPTGRPLDVTDGAAVDAVVAAVAAEHGRIDVLSCNAGIELPESPPVDETTDEQWRRLFAVNVDGMFRVCRAAIPHMPAGASIVNMASMNSFVAWPGNATYTATKGAVLQFTRALALDVVGRGVRANAVCPGVIDTPLTGAFLDLADDREALRAEYAAVSPMNRMGTAREVANCVLFLASEESSFVTASALLVDGGSLAQP
jgi:NAD(P)-dependent dehydrogenase (short-subunit alcohol dehydrogenase family)